MSTMQIIALVVAIVSIIAIFLLNKDNKKDKKKKDSNSDIGNVAVRNQDNVNSSNNENLENVIQSSSDTIDSVNTSNQKTIEQPFQTSIKPTFLIQELNTINKLFKLTVVVNNNEKQQFIFNTTYLNEIIGRFIYSGEVSISYPSHMRELKVNYLPYDSNPKNYEKDNAIYVEPCKVIGKEQFQNSIFNNYTKINHTISMINRKLNNESINDLTKDKNKMGRFEKYFLNQILQYIILPPESRNRMFVSENFKSILDIFNLGEEDVMNISIHELTPTEISMVEDKRFITPIDLDRWYNDFMLDTTFAQKVRVENLFKITDTLDKYKGKRSKEHIKELKEELSIIVGQDFNELHIKEILVFLHDYTQVLLDSVTHFRNKLCIINVAESHFKGLQVFVTLPEVKGL